MNRREIRFAGGALLVAASLAGCSDTAIVGSVLDADVATGNEQIQLALARGSNSEVTDIMTVGNGYKWIVLAGTDDILNDGTAGREGEWA